MKATVYSIVESPGHPNFSALYARLGLDEVRLTSQRNAIQAVKKQAPDYIVAEFFYGFGNNYAGVNISNLDVLLYTLQKYAPDTRVIVLVEKSQRQHVDKLDDILPLHAVLVYPVAERQLEALLR